MLFRTSLSGVNRYFDSDDDSFTTPTYDDLLPSVSINIVDFLPPHLIPILMFLHQDDRDILYAASDFDLYKTIDDPLPQDIHDEDGNLFEAIRAQLDTDTKVTCTNLLHTLWHHRPYSNKLHCPICLTGGIDKAVKVSPLRRSIPSCTLAHSRFH